LLALLHCLLAGSAFGTEIGRAAGRVVHGTVFTGAAYAARVGLGGSFLTAQGSLVGTSIIGGSLLPRSATFDNLFDDTFESAVANTSLSVASESIMTGEAVTTSARVWLHPGMDLAVSLEVVLADKALLTVDASVLPISEMRLNVRSNVLLAPKDLATLGKEAGPLA